MTWCMSRCVCVCVCVCVCTMCGKLLDQTDTCAARRLRKAGDMVDEESWSALILPDYCFVPHSQHMVSCAHPPTTISLEIKVGCIQIRLVFWLKEWK